MIVIKNINIDKKSNKLNTWGNKKRNFIAEEAINIDENCQNRNEWANKTKKSDMS